MKCMSKTCGRLLTPKQQKAWTKNHAHKMRPPPPACSPQCRADVKKAPPKSERTETWARNATDGKKFEAYWGRMNHMAYLRDR